MTFKILEKFYRYLYNLPGIFFSDVGVVKKVDDKTVASHVYSRV